MPTNISKAEQRQFPRFRFREPVKYYLRDRDFGGCLGEDLSDGGLRMNFPDFVPLGTEVTVELRVTGRDRPQARKGHVVWVQKVPFSERYQLGIRFESATSTPQIQEGNSRFAL